MKTIIDVENASAEDIKSNKSVAVDACRSEKELAERFVKTLIDAKLRDGRLSEQGKLITEQSDLIKAMTAKLESSVSVASQLKNRVEELEKSLSETIKEKVAAVAMSERMEAEAKAANHALYQAEAALKTAIANRSVDEAKDG